MSEQFYTKILKFDCDPYTDQAVREAARCNSMKVAEYLRAVVRDSIKGNASDEAAQ